MGFSVDKARSAVTEEARDLPVAFNGDVIVAGGGPAGFAAALGAARNGAKVLLIERAAFLGGTATTAMMAVFGTPYEHAQGISREVFDRLISIGAAAPGPLVPFDPEAFRTVALEMVDEAGVNLLLYSWVVDVIREGDVVKGVVVENKSGRQALLADVIIDTTGDADIAAKAGAPFVKGRESDGRMRPITLLFRLGHIDVPKLMDYVTSHPEQFSPDPAKHIVDVEGKNVRLYGFFDLVEEGRKSGVLPEETHYLRLEALDPVKGTAFVNSTRVYNVDGTNAWDLTRAELEARRQVIKIMKFIRASIPGCEKSYVIETAPGLGVRETRRIRGGYILTEDDIVQERPFPDSVAQDAQREVPYQQVHSPDGNEGGRTDVAEREMLSPLFIYAIPYRCLVPNDVEGLLVAGRCISVTHEADGFTRNMPACMSTGQAVGTAAALASRLGLAPRQLDVAKIQDAMLAQGAKIGPVERGAQPEGVPVPA